MNEGLNEGFTGEEEKYYPGIEGRDVGGMPVASHPVGNQGQIM